MAELKQSGIDWIGEIPNNWETRQIRYLFSLRDERNYKPLNEVNLISVYTDKGVLQHADIEQTTGNKAQNADGYKHVYKNDLVVNIILCWMGALGISDYDGVTSPAYDVYAPNDLNKVFPKYYHYLFRTPQFNGKCYTEGRGIMQMRWRTYSSEFKSIKIPLPPLAEQKRIADFLDKKCSEIDSIIDEAKKSIEEYKAWKQSVIFEAVTGKNLDCKKKDSGIEWIGEIPEDWKFIKLPLVLTMKIVDGTHQTPEYTYKEDGVAFLSAKDVTSGKIDWTKIKYITKELHNQLYSEIAPQKNDILLAKNGTTGIAALVEDDSIFDIYVTLAVLRPNTNLILPKFLLYMVNSTLCKRQFDNHLLGIGVPNLHLEDIKQTKILLPSLSEQEATANVLDSKCSQIDSLIAEKESLISDLSEYKKSLIFEVGTGKRSVQ